MSPSREMSPCYASCDLDGLPGSVGAARDFATALFGAPEEPEPVADPVLGEALLVVSELISNAVRHAAGRARSA